METTRTGTRRKSICRRGFTIIEIILAMGIFTMGIAYVFELFQHSLRLTEKARQQVILAIVFQDIRQKQQTAAVLAVNSTGEDTFAENGAGGGWETSSGRRVGLHDYGSNWDATKLAYDALTPDTDDINNITGEFESDLVNDYDYDEVSIYGGFMFAVNTVLPIEKESDQFTDYNGYVATNADGDEVAGITEEDIAEDWDGGGISNYGSIYDFGEPAPTPGAWVKFDPEGLRHYIRRFECIIVFDFDGDPIEYPNMFIPGGGEAFDNPLFCQHGLFYFDIFNPDTDKDSTMLP